MYGKVPGILFKTQCASALRIGAAPKAVWPFRPDGTRVKPDPAREVCGGTPKKEGLRFLKEIIIIKENKHAA